MKVAPYPLVESLPSRPPMTFGTLPNFAALTGLPDYVPCFIWASRSTTLSALFKVRSTRSASGSYWASQPKRATPERGALSSS